MKKLMELEKSDFFLFFVPLQYFSEATEALTWLEQKQPSWKAFGSLSDEESLLSLLKRLESLQLDLDAFSVNSLAKLRRDSANLCSSQPKEVVAITTMQVQNHFKVPFSF